MRGLGLIDTRTKSVRPKSNYSHLIAPIGSLKKTDPIINADGSIPDTVSYMMDIVKKYHKDTERLAQHLRSDDLFNTLKNTYDFVDNHIQYEKDNSKIEQLRQPLRTLHDQKGDCDCMSILIGSILYNLKIPFSFRITKYDGKKNYQHVYVVVPFKNAEVKIDPVVGIFNYEKPYSQKKDYTMNGLEGMPIQLLNGVTNDKAIDIVEMTKLAMGTDLEKGIQGLGSIEEDQALLFEHLVKTRNAIASDPDSFKYQQNPDDMLKMFDHAIKYYNTPHRDKVLADLARAEENLIAEGKIKPTELEGIDEWEDDTDFDGINAIEEPEMEYKYYDALSGVELTNDDFILDDAEEDIDGLEGLGRKRKGKARRKARRAKRAAKPKSGFFKRVAVGAKKGLKKVGHGIARFNPVSTSARGGLLAWFRLNLKKSSDKLKWAYMPKELAEKKGLTLKEHADIVEALKKTENLFVKKLKGKPKNLKKAILAKGRAKDIGMANFKGIDGFGEPATIASAAAITTAAPFIAKVAGFLKKLKLGKAAEKLTAKSAERRASGKKGIIRKIRENRAAKGKGKIFDKERRAERKASRETKPIIEKSKAFVQTEAANAFKSATTGKSEAAPVNIPSSSIPTSNVKVNFLTASVDWVKANPVKTGLIATGVGLGIAALTPKGRKALSKPFTKKAPSANRPSVTKTASAKQISKSIPAPSVNGVKRKKPLPKRVKKVNL